MTQPEVRVQFDPAPQRFLRLGRLAAIEQHRPQAHFGLAVFVAARRDRLAQIRLGLSAVPQGQVRQRHLVVGLVITGRSRDRRLKIRQRARQIFVHIHFFLTSGERIAGGLW